MSGSSRPDAEDRLCAPFEEHHLDAQRSHPVTGQAEMRMKMPIQMLRRLCRFSQCRDRIQRVQTRTPGINRVL